uniref:Uncharacterized protein n=1 Tax=Arundo donax TaxID=35708 RepID=A0A0A8YNA0_ARUDO
MAGRRCLDRGKEARGMPTWAGPPWTDE